MPCARLHARTCNQSTSSRVLVCPLLRGCFPSHLPIIFSTSYYIAVCGCTLFAFSEKKEKCRRYEFKIQFVNTKISYRERRTDWNICIKNYTDIYKYNLFFIKNVYLWLVYERCLGWNEVVVWSQLKLRCNSKSSLFIGWIKWNSGVKIKISSVKLDQ